MIVIPMAGLSSRFFKEGYTQPKYMLQAYGIPLFDHAVLSFREYFYTLPFLFIVRDAFDTREFVRQRCEILGIKNYRIVVLEELTRGQAETVYLGIAELDNSTPLTIFNIDTFRPNFVFPEVVSNCDGYIEVFKGEGSNWSYVRPASMYSNIVLETAEKKPISDLCSTGLYHFKQASDFRRAFETESSRSESEWQSKELYIAPLYNYLINEGKNILFNLIDRKDVIFCGIPEEYLEYISDKI